MGNINSYDKFFENKDNSDSKFDKIKEYNKEWKEKCPELKVLKLEYDSDTQGDNCNWLYSLNKKFDDVNIDMFIEVVYSGNWKIDFELVIESDMDSSSVQDEKHYYESNLTYDNFLIELDKVCYYIRNWNKEFHKEYDIHPLID